MPEINARRAAIREITHHRIPHLGDEVSKNKTSVHVMDEPGEGGACHHYEVRRLFDPDAPGADPASDYPYPLLGEIRFQNGPAVENGVNGIFDEHLIAVLIDRLQGFQSGAFACPPNMHALSHLECALAFLRGRTVDRVERGVEGKSEK